MELKLQIDLLLRADFSIKLFSIKTQKYIAKICKYICTNELAGVNLDLRDLMCAW